MNVANSTADQVVINFEWLREGISMHVNVTMDRLGQHEVYMLATGRMIVDNDDIFVYHEHEFMTNWQYCAGIAATKIVNIVDGLHARLTEIARTKM